jgi:TRAF3-interacting protein 1
MDAKSITEKDAKINFLTKLITLTEMIIGEEIDVKPNKIVAGHEPEKTNAFLQAMFQAASAGIDTRPYVN